MTEVSLSDVRDVPFPAITVCLNGDSKWPAVGEVLARLDKDGEMFRVVKSHEGLRKMLKTIMLENSKMWFLHEYGRNFRDSFPLLHATLRVESHCSSIFDYPEKGMFMEVYRMMWFGHTEDYLVQEEFSELLISKYFDDTLGELFEHFNVRKATNETIDFCNEMETQISRAKFNSFLFFYHYNKALISLTNKDMISLFVDLLQVGSPSSDVMSLNGSEKTFIYEYITSQSEKLAHFKGLPIPVLMDMHLGQIKAIRSHLDNNDTADPNVWWNYGSEKHTGSSTLRC